MYRPTASIPDSVSVTRWRIFYTTVHAEKKCETRLAENGIEVFLPKIVTTRRWKNGVRRKIADPLFPNYIFAHVNEKDRLRVLDTPGIVRSVMSFSRLAELSEEEITQLQISQREPERLAAMVFPRPGIGDWIEIQEGPLAGLHGEVLEHRGETHLLIRVDAIRQAVRVHLPDDCVRSLRCTKAA